jgi:hypothetical protein
MRPMSQRCASRSQSDLDRGFAVQSHPRYGLICDHRREVVEVARVAESGASASSARLCEGQFELCLHGGALVFDLQAAP